MGRGTGRPARWGHVRKITLSSVAVALCVVFAQRVPVVEVRRVRCRSGFRECDVRRGEATVGDAPVRGRFGRDQPVHGVGRLDGFDRCEVLRAARHECQGSADRRQDRSTAPPAPHDDDSYAFAHRCYSSQVTLQVSPMTDVPTRRLITVRNTGATSCGLSYFPLVDLGSAQSADHSEDVKPLIPGGLGGPPAYVLYAGKTAYAVLDLNPGGSGSGPATTLDEINVLVSDCMPNAATQNFPLGGGSVGKPKLGLYEQASRTRSPRCRAPTRRSRGAGERGERGARLRRGEPGLAPLSQLIPRGRERTGTATASPRSRSARRCTATP